MKNNKENKNKKILVFVGANRKSKYNVSIECIKYLTTNFKIDTYKFVVTDDDKEIIKFLKKNNFDYLKKNNILKTFDKVRRFEFDWLLNIWGHSIFKSDFLKKFKNNLNIHPSYLPYGKGKDSIVWTIINDYPAGVTIHEMNHKLDAGPIFLQKRIKFNPDIIAGKKLYEKSLAVAIEIFCQNWKRIRLNKVKPKKQKEINSKIHYRSELLKKNVINLNSAKYNIVKKFLRHSNAQNFYPSYNIKLIIGKNEYKFIPILEKIK